MIGSPMGAAGFATLAPHFPDRTVVTYDPRGVERSSADRRRQPSHARRARRRPRTGSSRRSAAARSTCSPPAAARSTRWRCGRAPATGAHARRPRAAAGAPCCPTARRRSRPTRDIARHLPARRLRRRRWRSSSRWSRYDGPGARRLRRPAGARPRRCSGCRPRTTARRDDALLGAEHPHLHPLRARRRRAAGRADARSCSPRGEESEGEIAHRGAVAVADALGTEPVVFPGDHAGFLGGEYGQTGEPEAFAARLREVLAAG